MRTFRKSVPQTGDDITIPSGIKFVVIKNVGDHKMAFNFDDDGINDFYSLEIAEKTPIMHVQSGQKFNYKGIGGNSTIEVLAWS